MEARCREIAVQPLPTSAFRKQANDRSWRLFDLARLGIRDAPALVELALGPALRWWNATMPLVDRSYVYDEG